jgi:BMFP domain-containing protein YqiC
MPEQTPPNFDELISRIISAIPGSLLDAQKDLEHTLKAALNAGLSKMNLVTREEFEIQKSVLARSRAKLDEMEKTIAELMARIEDK